MNQIDLNRKLYEEFEKKELNETRIIELLKEGANPLGNMSNEKWSEEPYEEIIYENKNLDKITKILLENGMIIDNKNYPNQDDDINPLWSLALRPDTIGIKTLKLLLDYNTEIESIEVFVDHIYTDYIFLENKVSISRQATESGEEKNLQKHEEFAMKMLMLCASYEYVINNSDYIKSVINYSKNNKDLLKIFNNHNNVYLKETNKELRFYNKIDNSLVWTIYY